MAVNGLPGAGKGTGSGSLGSSAETGKGGGGGGRGKDGEDRLADAGAAGIISSVSSATEDCADAGRTWAADRAARNAGRIKRKDAIFFMPCLGESLRDNLQDA
jgi:hypothetical protein